MSDLYYSIGYAFGAVSLLCMASFFQFRGDTPGAKVWSALCVFVAIWFGGRLLMHRSCNEQEAWIAQEILYFGAIYLNVIYFHFCTALLNKTNYRRILLAGYALATVLFVVNLVSRLFISEVRMMPHGHYYEQMGPLYYFHLLLYLTLPGAGMLLLIKDWRVVDAQRRNQLSYMIAASVIGFVCGFSTLIPVMVPSLQPIGGPLVSIYVFIIAYAVYRHQLMDISVVVRRTLVYSISVSVLGAIYLALMYIGARTLESMMGLSPLVSSFVGIVVVVTVFQPLKNRVQQVIDRAFFKERVQSLPNEIRDEILSLYSGQLTHELKSPLAHILMPSELAMRDLQDVEDGKTSFKAAFPKVREKLQYVIDQVLEANRRFEAIRELTSERGSIELILAADIVRSAISETGSLKNAPRVHLGEGSQSYWIEGHRKQLELVFINLFKNAGEAKATEVAVHLKITGSQLTISVQDNGEGIPAENLARIFDPNFTTKGKSGTGIGLYLSRVVVERHGGKISARSRPARGTLFEISLPLKKR